MFESWQQKFYAPDGASGAAAASSSGASPAAPEPSAAPAAPSSAGNEGSTPSSPPNGGEGAAPSSPSEKKPVTPNFAFMDYEDEPGVPLEPAAPPAEGGQEEGSAAPQPAPAQPAPASPQPQPGEQSQPVAQPQQAAETVPPLPDDPGQLLESMRSVLPQILEQVSQRYTLSQEEADALETNVVETLPKLLGKLHVQTTIAALHNLQQFVPAMIQRALDQNTRRSENLSAFYKQWPALKQGDPTHDAALEQIGTAYRQANPQATREQAIKAIGLLTMHHLGLPLSPPPSGNGTARPFVPAVGGVASAPPPAQPHDPFSGMGLDFDE